MYGNGSQVKRAVEMLTDTVPRSALLSLLCKQIGDQIRHDIRDLENEVQALENRVADEPDAAAAIPFRQGALRALKGEANRWAAVSEAFSNAPETRPANPANFAFVELGGRE
ncbi:hypothetical protein [Rhodococcus oryzae]|uniref:hypothetical protein n=1 Tax=Rhodococcus oryzae TaxID=2571143 RepID=UPI00378FAEAD